MDGRYRNTTTLQHKGVGRPTEGRMARGIALLRSLGPYAALELVLPGGSLLALLLWLYRHRSTALLTPRPLLQSQHISCC